MPGTTATTLESFSFERAVRAAASEFKNASPTLIWQQGYSAKQIATLSGHSETESYLFSGLSPDGGIWVDSQTSLPILTAEAKHQGKAGNAIERYYKNHALISRLNPNALHLLFCEGEGFFNNNSAQRIIGGGWAIENGGAQTPKDQWWNAHHGRSSRIYRYFQPESPSAQADMVASMREAFNAAFRSLTEGPP